MQQRSMNVDLKVGETLNLSGDGVAAVTLEHKSGQRARLRIEADESVSIDPPVSGRGKGEPKPRQGGDRRGQSIASMLAAEGPA